MALGELAGESLLRSTGDKGAGCGDQPISGDGPGLSTGGAGAFLPFDFLSLVVGTGLDVDGREVLPTLAKANPNVSASGPGGGGGHGPRDDVGKSAPQSDD